MPTEASTVPCVRCGANTDLRRADIAYCVGCMNVTEADGFQGAGSTDPDDDPRSSHKAASQQMPRSASETETPLRRLVQRWGGVSGEINPSILRNRLD
jgi:hypothetical protein